MKWRLWLAAPIALALGGCDFAPRYAAPSVATPSKFKDETGARGTLPVTGEWWLAFHDRTLNSLQAEVDAANPDLAAAVASNDAAVARANEALSSAYPQVNAVPHFLANKQSANRPLRSANQPTYYGDNLIGAQTAYEIDIWGRVRDIVASANATAEASADALADAKLELHAELARDYVNLRGFDDQAKLLSDTIAIYRSALKLTQDRLAANIASPVDVDRAQAQLSSAEAQLSDLLLNRATLENSIAALVGKSAASFSVSRSSARLPLPRPPGAVPADVLRRRPDVAQAERQTAAASELIGASRANFFPRVSFLALGGTQDTNFRLFNPHNLLGTIGPSIDIPLFDAGLRQAELAVAKAQFTEAAEGYRSTVLRAMKEIQDELSSLRWLAEEYNQTTTAATAARRAADLSLTLYRDGASSYLDVVTAQSAALEAERLAIVLHTRQLAADIGLMLALGGGWTVPPPEPRARPGFAPYLAD
ncbi:MAG TPA: efflux transporter outer membrane subunit [Roseiarcus sp.]|jgi:NodT family efflux transporter outer membrane factor (OMF) lipoprotein